jgi:formamidopyrimidine-DNA glycosylase
MPELPEVETMVRGIRPHCEGRELVRLEFLPCSRRPIQVSPRRERIAKLVEGQTISRVRRLAKRIVMELNSNRAIVVEPRMTGLMLVSDPPSSEHRRVAWHFRPLRNRASSVEFWDRRGLGTLSLYSPDQLARLERQLGPDALEMSDAEWIERLRRLRRAIKVALLDQTLVAGIGNLYASEALHRAGLSPRKRASRLRKTEVLGLAAAVRTILADAIRYEGSTLSDGTYRNALNKSGGYQNEHQVYDREGHPCQRCESGRIRRIVQSQRATFFCPDCQH